MLIASLKNFFENLPWRNIFFIVIILLCILSGTVASFLTIKYLNIKQNIIENVRKKAQQETARAAKEVDDFMRTTLPPLITSLANDLSTGKIPKDQLIKRLKEKAANVTGIGVAFAPYAYDKDIKLYAPYYVERAGKEELVQLESYYDYTQHQRYKQPFEHGAGYLEPFFDPASDTIVAEYGAPFYDRNGNKIGVTFANHSTEHLTYVISNMDLGSKGYGFIISQNGTYIAHPVKENVTQFKTIFQTATQMHNPQLEKLAKAAVAGKEGYIDHVNPTTGQKSWMFFEPIKSTGWSMVGVFIKDELALNTSELNRRRIQIFISFIIFFIMLCLLIFRIDTGTLFALWGSSLSISFFLLCGIIYIWYVAHTAIQYTMEAKGGTIILDRTTLQRFLQTSRQSAYEAQMTQKKENENQKNQKGATQPREQQMPSHHHHDSLPTKIDTSGHTHETKKESVSIELEHPQKPPEYVGKLSSFQDVEQVIQKIQQNISQASSLLHKQNEPINAIAQEKKEEKKDVKLTSPSIPVRPIGYVPSSQISQTQPSVPSPSTFTKTAAPSPALPSNHMHHQMPAAQPPAPPQMPVEQTGQMASMQNMPGMNMPGMAGMHHGMHGMPWMHGTAPTAAQNKNIPTGLYLNHLAFKGINSIDFIGYFWQHYLKGVQDNIKRGIIFPLAENIKITEAYKFDYNPWEVVGWSIQGTVNQEFNYAAYPFDTKMVRIQMWPADFDKEIILAADLDAYKVLTPAALPGIDPLVRLQEWTMARSFFSYKVNNYLTNFGNYIVGPFGTIDQSNKSATPELYFNITLRRHIISSLILDLFPIIVVFGILFMILFLVGKKLIENVNQVLATTVALFFTVILAHIRFKSAIPVQQIVFFEYFYFILHFLNICVTIICILYFLTSLKRLIGYENLLIPQLFYWPFVTFLILTLSLINFY